MGDTNIAVKNIVIVGAGYAGILTAKKLAKKFKKHEDVNVTIIDKNPFHTMLTELHEVAANRVDEDSIKVSLKKVFAGRKVSVKLDTVRSIDFEGKHVIGDNESYPYDYLVIAAGSKPTYFGVEGALEHAYKLWSYDDAVVLKERIQDCFRRAALETNPEEKRKLLTFYIVGAGFTGVEMSGELAEYVPILCKRFEIDRRDVRIVNVDVLSRCVTMLPEKLSNRVQRRLDKMGVELKLNTNVVKICNDSIELKSEEKSIVETAGTVIWAAGIEASDITGEAAKVLRSKSRGRIELDSYLRSIDDERVYVAGDNMFYIPEGEESSVPQMVENCEQSAAVVAKNIYSAVTGRGEQVEYKPSFHGVMVSIGGRYGVAHVGLPNFMFSLPSFLAMFTKHFINIIYFIQLLGWNKVFSYLKHEFFTIRNNRSFVGGHLSNKSPTFLLMPLRVWLGAVWVFEGIMKIVGGWFKEPMLKGFFGGADAWYQGIIDGVSGATTGSIAGSLTASVDAISSSTPAAESAGEVLFNLNFFGFIKAIFVSGVDLASATISDLAFKLDIPVMNWFIDKFITSSNGMQLFMQIFIVVAEILIGLALISGLFTTPASAFSLVLQAMFICTTGLYLSTFWMIFAAIALMFGSGRALGLDYYAMPWLKRAWRKLPFVRKLYIYHD